MHPGEHLCISGRLKDQRSPSEYVLGPAIDPHAKRRKRTGLSFTSHNHSVNTQTLVPSSIKHQASSIPRYSRWEIRLAYLYQSILYSGCLLELPCWSVPPCSRFTNASRSLWCLSLVCQTKQNMTPEEPPALTSTGKVKGDPVNSIVLFLKHQLHHKQ